VLNSGLAFGFDQGGREEILNDGDDPGRLEDAYSGSGEQSGQGLQPEDDD